MRRRESVFSSLPVIGPFSPSAKELANMMKRERRQSVFLCFKDDISFFTDLLLRESCDEQ